VSEREVLAGERADAGPSPTAAASCLAGPVPDVADREQPRGQLVSRAAAAAPAPPITVGVLVAQRPAGDHEATVARAAHPDSKPRGLAPRRFAITMPSRSLNDLMPMNIVLAP